MGVGPNMILNQRLANCDLWARVALTPEVVVIIVCGPQAKNGGYVFKWLKTESQKEDYFMTHKNYMKVKFQRP